MAARNVGSIQVTVEADTGKLKAQVTKGARTAGKEGAKVLGKELANFDQHQTLQAMQRLVEEIELQLEGIDDIELGLDAAALKQRVRAVKEEIEGTDVELTLDAVVTKLETQVREMREKQEADDLNLAIGLDVSEANVRLRAWKEDVERGSVNVRLGADIAAAEAKIEDLRAKEEADRLSLSIGADVAKINATMAEWRRKEEQNAVDINVGAAIAKANAGIAKWRAKQEAEALNISLRADVADINANMAEWRRKEEENSVPISIGLTIAKANAAMDKWRAKEERDALNLSLGVDVTKINAAMDAWRRAEETDAVDISIGLGIAKANAGMDAWRRAEEADALALKVSMTKSLYDAAVEAEAFRLAEEQNEIELKATLTTALFTAAAELDAFELEQQQREIELKVGLLTKKAQLEAIVLVEKLNRLRAKMEIDPNVSGAKFEKAKLVIDRMIGEVEAEIIPDIKGMKWFAAKEKIKTFMGNTGDESGGSFAGGLANGLQDGGKVVIAAIAAWGPGIAQGIEGLTGATMAVISSGLYAMAGGAGALAGTGAAAGAGLAAILVGSQGVPAALKAINDEFALAKEQGRPMRVMTGDVADALDNLSPHAASFALAFASVRDRFGEVREKVQEGLFEGLDTELTTFVQTTLPDIEGALVIAAGSMNRFFKGVAQAARETNWTETMTGLKPALDNALDSLVLFSGTLGPFLKTTGPAAEEFTGWLEDGAQSLKNWVIKNPEKLTSFFESGVDSLKLWSQMVGHFGDALGDIFGAGKGPGDHFVAQLDNVITKWNTFLEGPKGGDQLTDFFTKGQQAVIDIQPVVDSLKEAWQILTEGEGGDFATMMQEIADAVPGVAEVLVALSDLNLGAGISNTVQAFGALAEVFQLLPDGVKEFAGQLIVVSKLTGGVSSGIMAVAKASEKMALGFGIVAGLNLAITAGLMIWEHYSGDADEAKQSTDALASSLNASLTSFVSAGDAAEGSSAAVDVWNDALANTGDISDELRDEFSRLGLTMDDSKRIFDDFHKSGRDTAQAMEDLRENAGFAGDAFEGIGFGIGQLVSAGEDFDSVADKMWDKFEGGATAANMSRDSFDDNVRALYDLQKSVTGVDMNDVAQEALRAAASMDTESLAALNTAKNNLHLSGTIDDIINRGVGLPALFDEYANVMAGVTSETGKAEAAASQQQAVMNGLSGAYSDAELAAMEHADALKEERDAAFDAWEAELRLTETLRDQAGIAISRDFGIPREVTKSFGELGDKVRAATQAASDFEDVYDTLFGGTRSWMGAVSDVEEAADAFTDLLDGVSGVADENSETIDGWSERVVDAGNNVVDAGDHVATGFNLMNEAGRTLQDSAFAYADAILGIGKSGIEGGKGVGEITNEMNVMREQMHDNLVEFGFSEQAATDYINTLLGTPESMETIVSNPGLLEAMLNLEDLTILYDDAGNPVITEFEQLGIDPGLVTSQAFVDLINEINGTNIAPVVVTDEIVAASEKFRAAKMDADELAGVEARPQVFLEGITPAQEAGAALHAQMQVLDEGEVNPYVNPDSINNATAAAQGTGAALDAVGDKTPAPVVETSGIDPAAASAQIVADHLNNMTGLKVKPGVELTGAADANSDLDDTKEKLDTVGDTTADPTLSITTYLNVTNMLSTLNRILDATNDKIIDPTIQLSDYATVKTQLDTLQTEVLGLSAMMSTPAVRLDNYATVKGQIDTLQTEMLGLSGMVATPSIRLDGYSNTMTQIDNIQANIAATQNRTVTVTTQNVSTGAMAGRMVHGPQTINVGERGYAEAIIPLQLPLNRINPEVRDLAALIRGETPAQRMGSSKVSRLPNPINQYFTLTSADPEAVAVQTLNRAAAMVG